MYVYVRVCISTLHGLLVGVVCAEVCWPCMSTVSSLQAVWEGNSSELVMSLYCALGQICHSFNDPL